MNSLGAFYINTNISEIDPQIINIIKIAKKTLPAKVIFVNRIENGRGIRQVWPFISFDSIISLTPISGKIGLLLKLFIAFFRKDLIHVQQFLVISEKRSIIGYINTAIYRIASTRPGLAIKSMLR